MRMLVIVLALLLALGVGVAPAANEDLFAKAKAASWAVYTRDVGSLSATCSATAYATTETETLLVTAGHCFWPPDEKKDFLVTRNHKAFFDATLVANGYYFDAQGKQKGEDWSVVSVAGKYETVPLGDSRKLRLGEDVIMVGVPFGVDFLAVQGIVGSLDVSLSGLDWNHYLGINIYIAGGNSGTGVISVAQRAIVGIIVAGPGSQTSLAIAAPIQLVDVEKAKKRK